MNKKNIIFTIPSFVLLVIVIVAVSITGGMLIHDEYFSPNIRYFQDFRDIYSTHQTDINGTLEISHDDNSLTIKFTDK